MLDELKPVSVHALARQLGTDPIEIIRLRVSSESDLTHLAMPSHQVERIRVFSGIEPLCERISQSAEAPLTGHRWVPPLLNILLEGDRIGERTIRMDNLWRGLPSDDCGIVQNIVQVLLSEKILTAYSASSGRQISIHPDGVDAVRGLISGDCIPESLSFLWKA